MALILQEKKRRSPAKSHLSNIQPSSKAQCRNNQAVETNQYLTHAVDQLPRLKPPKFGIQPLEAQQKLFVRPAFLHSFQNEDEHDQVSQKIRALFEKEPEVAGNVLQIANVPQRPLVPNAHCLVKKGIVPAQHIDALRQSSLEVSGSRLPQPRPNYEAPTFFPGSVSPDPVLSQLPLTSSIAPMEGFLSDNPYAKVEHDWEGEVRMYAAQRKEALQKKRGNALTANTPMYPFAGTSSHPPRSTGYGKSMGNDGVGTLGYLGVSWDLGEKDE